MAEPVITDVPAQARLLLHCASADRSAMAGALALDLPEAMLRAGHARGWHALHLSPDEWLLIGSPDEAAALVARSASDGSAIAHSLVDIGERHLGVTVAGEGAADLLNAGCALDLSDDAFPVGACTRTLFGKADILLWRPTEAPAFRVEYARSFADYVRRLMSAASADL